MMEIVKRFLACPSTEKRLLLEAALDLLAVRVGLILLPFRTVTTLVNRASLTGTRARHGGWAHRDRVVRALTRAARYVPGRTTCLQEALVGKLLLTRNGYPVRLRIGVKKGQEGQLLAHAWVEDDHEVLIGGPLSRVRGFSSLQDIERIATEAEA